MMANTVKVVFKKLKISVYSASLCFNHQVLVSIHGLYG